MVSVKPVTDEEILGEVPVDIGAAAKHFNVTQGKMKVETSDGTAVSIYREAKFTPVNAADIDQDTTMDEEDDAGSEEKEMETTKKRGAGAAVASPDKKKRTPANTKVEIKSKVDVADDAAEEDVAKEDLKKATPKKTAPKKATPKKATPSKAKGSKAIKIEEIVEDEDEEDVEVVATDNVGQDKVNAAVTPSKARKRVPAKPGNIAAPRGIPTTWEDASPEDRMLFTMKEKETDWPTIRAAWTAKTGQVTGTSTLPNRYSRLKSALERLADGDEPLLIKAKEELEAKFEREKYELIAEAMVKLGTQKYTAGFIQKHLKVLAAKPKPKPAAVGLGNVAAGKTVGQAVNNK